MGLLQEIAATHHIYEEEIGAANKITYYVEPPLSPMECAQVAYAISDEMFGDGEGTIDPRQSARGQDEWDVDRANHRVSFGTPDRIDFTAGQISIEFPYHHKRHYSGKDHEARLRSIVQHALDSLAS